MPYFRLTRTVQQTFTISLKLNCSKTQAHSTIWPDWEAARFFFIFWITLKWYLKCYCRSCSAATSSHWLCNLHMAAARRKSRFSPTPWCGSHCVQINVRVTVVLTSIMPNFCFDTTHLAECENFKSSEYQGTVCMSVVFWTDRSDSTFAGKWQSADGRIKWLTTAKPGQRPH